MPTAQEIRAIFDHMAKGDFPGFFKNVADDVDWTVMGTHPCAGHYTTLADFYKSTIERLGNLMQDGIALQTRNIIIGDSTSGGWTVIELLAKGTCKNGLIFDNTYAWICRFDEHSGKIVQVRAYLDSVLVKQACEENECPSHRADTRIA